MEREDVGLEVYVAAVDRLVETVETDRVRPESDGARLVVDVQCSVVEGLLRSRDAGLKPLVVVYPAPPLGEEVPREADLAVEWTATVGIVKGELVV